MGVSLEVRRDRFANLVRRVLAEAGERGLTVPDVEKATGVSKTTFYRWRDKGWTRDPSASQVRGFFDGLNVPYQAAYRALDWADPEPGSAEPDPPLDPEIREILRKLNDPSVPESEKHFLRETISMLAARGARGGGRRGAGERRQAG